jgi:hypothetical protein
LIFLVFDQFFFPFCKFRILNNFSLNKFIFEQILNLHRFSNLNIL